MYGEKIAQVKYSLNYLVNRSESIDNFALVTFSSSAQIVHNFTKMTEENKVIFRKSIENLVANGNTNIYSGLEKGLNLLNNDYSSGERIASMILLSDGHDNYNPSGVISNFKNLMKTKNKTDYAFTVHTFGYGDNYNYELLKDISLIMDGSFFHVFNLAEIGDCYLTIYGFLSTVMDVNVKLEIESQFEIIEVYGQEDMHNAILKRDTISSFSVENIHIGYGRNYKYVVLVDVPKFTPFGTEVLNATVSKLKLHAKYYWDEQFSLPAYEEYIRCIIVIIFMRGYQLGGSGGILIFEAGIIWIEKYYRGTRNWIKELNNAISDLKAAGNSGKANLLSKITELKTPKVGAHYDEGNSYQRTLVDNYHGLDISKMEKIEIKGEKLINYTEGVNYYYFYLKKGNGKINNIPFSGESSSFVVYTNETSGNINITSLSDSMECYLLNKTVKRIQTIVDFNHIGKFIIKKDFPFDFYTKVDGKRDITFNIEILNSFNITDISEFIEINGYILTDNDIDKLINDKNSLNSFVKFKGNFDNELNIGKLVIKLENISDNLNPKYNNYLFITINKISDNEYIIPNELTGHFYFIPNNYIYSSITENYRVFSHLEQEDNSQHLYTLEIDLTTKNNLFKVEIDNLGNNDLDFKILNYQNYIDGLRDLYNDYNGFIIEKKIDSNKIYLNITQNKAGVSLNKIILSIFSTNENHKPSSNSSYIFKYTTDYREFPKELITTNVIEEPETQKITQAETTSKIIPKTEIATQKRTQVETELATQSQTEKIKPTSAPTIISYVVVKIKVIILGFAKFTYISSNKIINFFMYFVYMETTIYVKKISINANIKYKSSLRSLQDNSSTKGECVLEENYSNNDQKRYRCSIETNGEEISNIELDKNIKAEDDDMDFSDTKVSPMGAKYMNKIQEIGDEDPFNKKLYLLNSSLITVDNDNNEFNIVGEIKDDTNFNYKKIDLEISLLKNSVEELSIISCIPSKKENKYNLQCNTNNEIVGVLNSGFANLGNENLIVEISDSAKTNINFKEKYLKTDYRKSSGGLSAGTIVAIIVPIAVVLIASVFIIIYCYRKKKIISTNIGDSSIVPNNSYTNQID